MGAIRVHFGILLAILSIFEFSEGNHRASETASCNGGHWSSQNLDENTAEQVRIYCRKELGVGEITKTINKFNSKHDDIDTPSRKTLMHNARKELLSPVKHESLVKHVIRVDSVPKNKPPDHVLLLGIIVSTAIATLALFVLMVFCCLGGIQPRARSQCAQQDKKPKPVVNISPEGISGSSQAPQAVVGNKDLINSFSTNNLSTNVSSQTPELGKLPLPPGRSAPPPPLPAAPPPLPPPAPPPPMPPAPKAPPPPPPRNGPLPPAPPKPGAMKKPPGPPLPKRGHLASGDEKGSSGNSSGNKTKLKPFFWDKVNYAPNRSMVWRELNAGSFQFNEEMMESLFGYSSTNQNKGESVKSASTQPKLIQIIDPKKAQNLSIVLKALSATIENVCKAVTEGSMLRVELITSLIKMPPTQEEELKLRLYQGDLALITPADRFLKILVEVPFVYKRLEALLFMSSLHEESSPLKTAFLTLEVACTKLKNSRLFLKLLEAVLKTGNRMNVGTYRGGAQAIKLDSLLKLSDVKGTDGKTTLLTFVVQEIIQSEGIKSARSSNIKTNDQSDEYYRKLGLEVVSKLSNELSDVKKAAIIDGDHITSTVLKLENMLKKTRDLIDDELSKTEGAIEFCETFNGFMEHAESEIVWMLEEEKRIMMMVKSTGDFFHGNSAKDEGLRLFVIVRDFLKLLDIVCIEIKKNNEKNSKKKNIPLGKRVPPGPQSRQLSWSSVRDKLFPAMKDKKMDSSSSDDDDDDMSP
ncbi:unnamed protein product [Lactuca virosa]|uniref:Formin-like protein n=1 Tax=Lactuca virosa TaxID=75947 RepID=A0AAU9M3G2_9ASTR|nr:unnamed protein product [Lactuca virosa]